VILVALGLIGLGVTDLVRWSPARVGIARAFLAAVAGAFAVVAVAVLGNMEVAGVLLAGAVALAFLSVWSAYDLLPLRWAKPEYPLLLTIGLILVLLGLGGLADPVGGDLADWYSHLGFGFAQSVSADRFILAVGAVLFVLGTGNRLVRFTLAATKVSLLEGEGVLRGGRVLGPMERLIIVAAVISGDLAGAGFVIAAKGLLRFREMRERTAAGSKVDEITEYFLIGTFHQPLDRGGSGSTGISFRLISASPLGIS
jgi:hypothetical protein